MAQRREVLPACLLRSKKKENDGGMDERERELITRRARNEGAEKRERTTDSRDSLPVDRLLVFTSSSS